MGQHCVYPKQILTEVQVTYIDFRDKFDFFPIPVPLSGRNSLVFVCPRTPAVLLAFPLQHFSLCSKSANPIY